MTDEEMTDKWPPDADVVYFCPIDGEELYDVGPNLGCSEHPGLLWDMDGTNGREAND